MYAPRLLDLAVQREERGAGLHAPEALVDVPNLVFCCLFGVCGMGRRMILVG